MEDVILWIWLQNCLGASNPHFNNAMDYFENVQSIYAADKETLLLSDVFTEKECIALSDKNLKAARDINDICVRHGYNVICYGHKDYPQLLKNLEAPPCVLYVSGKLPLPNGNGIAIVGTRTPTSSGKKTAFDFAYNLAKKDKIIVSGGALGIDSAAHKGALQAEGKTVCVLGCGLNYDYLKDNRTMREAITENGAVISEYPPDYPPARFTFPRRNRIIAALARCTVVVEAGRTSGALITARDAVKLKRRIFAVPGGLDNPQAAGTNLLLREGASVATCAEDILKDMNVDSPSTTVPNVENIGAIRETAISDKKTKILLKIKEKEQEQEPKQEQAEKAQKTFETKTPPPLPLSKNAETVYTLLESGGLTADMCVQKSGLPIHAVLTALTELEISGIAVCRAGNRYERL